MKGCKSTQGNGKATQSEKTKPKNTPVRRDPWTTFTSRGAGQVGLTPTGNQFKLLNLQGTPWDGSQAGAWGWTTQRIRLNNYFGEALFSAYDYFRMKSCESTVSWGTAPANGGPIIGEMFYYFDKDTTELNSYIQIANRRELKQRLFTNEKHAHVLTWEPHVVEDLSEGEKDVPYVYPRDRWLSTDNYNNFRFGSLMMIFTTPYPGEQYPDNDPVVFTRHRIILEFKGQRSLQASPDTKMEVELVERIPKGRKSTASVRSKF